MTYIVSPTDPTTPADGDDALQGAEELRALKAYILALAGLGTGVNLYRKNAIIGGDFATNPYQLGTLFPACATGSYVADMFYLTTVGVQVFTANKDITNAPTVAQAGYFTNASQLFDCTTINAAPAAADSCVMITSVEGYNFRPLAQKPMTLTLWHAHTKVGINSIGFRNSAADRYYIAEYSQLVSGAWEKATITVPASPVAGTWDYSAGLGLQILFNMIPSANNFGTVGAWTAGTAYCSASQVNNSDNVVNNCEFALIQLESGSAGTLFEQRTIQDELLLCQRYYEKSYKPADAPGAAGVEGDNIYGGITANIPNNGAIGTVQYQTRKRTLVPTVLVYSSAGVLSRTTDGGGVDYAANSGTTANVTDRKFTVYNTSGGALVIAGSLIRHHWTASSRF